VAETNEFVVPGQAGSERDLGRVSRIAGKSERDRVRPNGSAQYLLFEKRWRV
jgi:hypothetical protein